MWVYGSRLYQSAASKGDGPDHPIPVVIHAPMAQVNDVRTADAAWTRYDFEKEAVEDEGGPRRKTLEVFYATLSSGTPVSIGASDFPVARPIKGGRAYLGGNCATGAPCLRTTHVPASWNDVDTGLLGVRGR